MLVLLKSESTEMTASETSASEAGAAATGASEACAPAPAHSFTALPLASETSVAADSFHGSPGRGGEHERRGERHPHGQPRALGADLAQAFAPSLGSRRLAPSRIFFTHDSIRNTFSDGRRVEDTLQQLRDGTIRVADIPCMQVCWQTDRLWTYTGNRRLWVFRNLEEEGVIADIEVLVVNKKVPKMRMTTKNGGTSVRVRGS